MSAYYNEIDPYCAQWLRNLIDGGMIAPGEVDERSILDVKASDLKGFTQCHFFAGIAAWSHALRLAGWPDDKPAWTGSCPCQPFSVAGKGKGADDERHLWPAWFNLIAQCKPPTIFGEQVDAAIKHGWLDTVQADLEATSYTFGAANIPASGVGAPHIRQRVWFVANSDMQHQRSARQHKAGDVDACGEVETGRVALSDSRQCQLLPVMQGDVCNRKDAGLAEGVGGSPSCGENGRRGHPGPTNGYWRNADWLRCRDGKWRPVEPSTFPLAVGATGRVGRLRAYGNSIAPQVAAEFIRASMEE